MHDTHLEHLSHKISFERNFCSTCLIILIFDTKHTLLCSVKYRIITWLNIYIYINTLYHRGHSCRQNDSFFGMAITRHTHIYMDICLYIYIYINFIFMFYRHRCLISNVSTAALALKHQAISIQCWVGIDWTTKHPYKNIFTANNARY